MIKTNDLYEKWRRGAEEREEKNFHPKAAFSKLHSRYFGKEDDHRLPYKRDVDRIVHSKAYSRYIDKTQVVYLVDNDHVTHRGQHVQLVSQFARGIGEILELNLDLIEAISLGHDVGHPPFGHEGEGYLSELTQEYNGCVFAHPWQSCRLFTFIEPLNLGHLVYDGFLCHDGGLEESILKPRFGKTWDDHFEDLKHKLLDPEKTILPASLEGCLVKICDTMSYLGKDIEDAITLGILKREEVPKTHLGATNRDILNTLQRDVIKESMGQDFIALSNESMDALKVIRAFNFERIYTHPRLKVESKKIKRAYRYLFEYFLKEKRAPADSSLIWSEFLHDKPKNYLEMTNDTQKVTDYIAGMTDHYFVRTLEKVLVPQRIVW